MKRIKIAELKAQLSRVLRAVERGAEYEVTDRDRPIARVVPADGDAPRVEIRPAKRRIDRAAERRERLVRLPFDPVDVLLEDRRRR
jgi:prevent-host-death family protein